MIDTDPFLEHRQWVYDNSDLIEASLGPDGNGALVVPTYNDPVVCSQAVQEVLARKNDMERPPDVPRDKQGKPPVVQNYLGMAVAVERLDDEFGSACAMLARSATAHVKAIGMFLHEEATQLSKDELRLWAPDTAFVNLYPNPDVSPGSEITNHKDPSIYKTVIVTDVMQGPGVVGVVNDDGEIIEQWRVGAGDRMIFRANGLYEAVDSVVNIGPEHHAYPLAGEDRIVLTYRQSGGAMNPDANPSIYHRSQYIR